MKQESEGEVNRIQNWEIQWSQGALQMELAAAMRYFHKLFHLIRATGRKALSVNETICEADDSSIHSRQ